MDEILLLTEEKMEAGVEHLLKGFRTIRTGRASAGLVDHIKVDYYGTPTDLRQLASISVQEATTIVIKPFDASCIKDVERTIQASDLGITPMSDGKVIRLTVPPLSIERRNKLATQVKKMGEAAKVTVRNARRDANKELDKLQKASEITEDDCKKAKDDVQKLTNGTEKKINEILDAKILEIQES